MGHCKIQAGRRERSTAYTLGRRRSLGQNLLTVKDQQQQLNLERHSSENVLIQAFPSCCCPRNSEVSVAHVQITGLTAASPGRAVATFIS